MDGDVADLRSLSALSRAYGATLIVDDAHGVGVLGPRGAGTAEAQGVEDGVDLVIATFSKAFGTVGGVIAGPEPVMHFLRHHARSFLFTAALPPGAAAGVLAALDIIEREPERRHRLTRNSDELRRRLRALGFTVLGEATPVIPVLVGGQWWPTLEAWRLLFDEGVLVNAVLPPAVPKGAARLRVTVTSEHSAEEIDRIVLAFERLAESVRPGERAVAPALPAARGS
jgi:7-keto-8-aminopelargonate synthetase-like enzyme